MMSYCRRLLLSKSGSKGTWAPPLHLLATLPLRCEKAKTVQSTAVTMSTTATVTPPVKSNQTTEIVLYQMPRGLYGPSLSPFALKLETYLRVANLPYKNVLSGKPSPSKKKIPWIKLKGREVSDSQIIIWNLNKEYGIDLDKNLTPEQLAQAHCLRRMVEEAFYWQLIGWWFQFGFEKNSPMMMEAFKKLIPGPGFMKSFILGRIRKGGIKTLYAQGTGRFTEQEAVEFGKRDIQALSDFLGGKQFMMGDTISEVDCSVFGAVCQPLYQMEAWPVADYLREKTPNLVKYTERIKAQYWPDWDECTQQGAKNNNKE